MEPGVVYTLYRIIIIALFSIMILSEYRNQSSKESQSLHSERMRTQTIIILGGVHKEVVVTGARRHGSCLNCLASCDHTRLWHVPWSKPDPPQAQSKCEWFWRPSTREGGGVDNVCRYVEIWQPADYSSVLYVCTTHIGNARQLVVVWLYHSVGGSM